jgi:hypothetical protein
MDPLKKALKNQYFVEVENNIGDILSCWIYIYFILICLILSN